MRPALWKAVADHLKKHEAAYRLTARDDFNARVVLKGSKALVRAFYQPREGDVPGELRSRAKVVNFGVLYGMSAFRLSNELGISGGQAKDWIEAASVPSKVAARLRIAGSLGSSARAAAGASAATSASAASPTATATEIAMHRSPADPKAEPRTTCSRRSAVERSTTPGTVRAAPAPKWASARRGLPPARRRRRWSRHVRPPGVWTAPATK